jgi:hypothetical protein
VQVHSWFFLSFKSTSTENLDNNDGPHLFSSSAQLPKNDEKNKNKEKIPLWSISPTFYQRICANILAPKKFKPKM